MKTEPPATGRGLRGVGVSNGIAIGPAHIVESGAAPVPEYRLAEDQIEAECQRFADALTKAHRQIGKLKVKSQALPESAAEDVGVLLDAHLAMLSGSRLTRGVERRIREERLNAEAAVQAEVAALAHSFAAMDDAYLAARAADVREVGARLIRNLMQHAYSAFSMLPVGTVVVAEELSPADTALMDPTMIAGLATMLGGPEGHTAIMARSLGLPAVLGVAGLLTGVRNGDTVIVDGIGGRVIANPDEHTLAEYRARRDALARERDRLKRLRDLPSVTRDGVEIALEANLELPRELATAVEYGAAGIGLLRTEFLYMNREDIPGEDEQYQIIRDLVEGMGKQPVTVRTLDAGGDKIAAGLSGRFGESANPALGLRAIRLGLREPALLESQLAAILRAGAHGPVRILVPMITSVSEVRRVREILGEVAQHLRRLGRPIADPLPPLGAMIEVPGAALTADALAEACDFFAIGTNDLTQYTLAIDRGDEQVAHLYDPLHPAVLRLIQFACEAANRARIPVSVCGEIAGDPRFTALLVGFGVRALSMAPASVPVIKQRLRQMDVIEASRRARAIMETNDAGRIAAMLDDLNALA